MPIVTDQRFENYRRKFFMVIVLSGIDGLTFYALSGYLSTSYKHGLERDRLIYGGSKLGIG